MTDIVTDRRLQAWRRVVENLNAGRYRHGSKLQASLEFWRKQVSYDCRSLAWAQANYQACAPRDRAMLAQSLTAVRERRLWRREWLQQQDKYRDGTPIPNSLPF